MFFQIAPRSSECVEVMYVNPLGIVEVAFNKGCIYRYTNVSRRAIINLLLNKNISLGFWVNHNCKMDVKVKCERLLLAYANQIPTFA